MKEETQQPSDKSSELDRAQEEYMAQFQNEKGEDGPWQVPDRGPKAF
jgi:hypothetical protein